MDEARIQLEDKLLDRIKGKIDPSQAAEIKEAIIEDAFFDFCNSAEDEACAYGMRYVTNQEGKEGFFRAFQSYGIIQPLLDDQEIEDIIINGTQPIFVHHAQEGLKKTGVRFFNSYELELFIKKLLTFAGKHSFNKINNIDLPGMRGRVNIVYSPLGPELTITKAKANPFSIIDLIEKGSLNAEIASLLWLYVEGLGVKPANILISGGPGCGKTTLLNALLSFVPSDQHLVVIEDVMELVTHWIGNVSRLESDENLSLADLVKNSLRMRPERIIIGETRGAEAGDMVTAMNVGKYCMTTIHASSVRETILRLQSNPMNVPETLINLIDVFVVVRKMSVAGRISRVVDEIAESAGLVQTTVLVSPLWKFDSATHSFLKLLPPSVYRDRLNQVSGLSGRQIMDELNNRKGFLDSLRQAAITDIKEVSYYCERYIRDPLQAVAEVNRLSGSPRAPVAKAKA